MTLGVEHVRQDLTISEQRTKVIFDTNIWISYLIGHQLDGLTIF
ncbi:MAG: hypothetical protein AAGI25_20070 [Bacteroidota bacterium]